jgi:predicted AlkP superfamily phosphohydrolase/phosphomutase
MSSKASYVYRLLVGVTLTCVALSSQAEKRVIILGFDGVDPGIVQTMFDAGELKNLKALGEMGTFTPLGSSNPPQSPTAWSSFSTSKHPGNHGIYDFLLRTPKTYRPGVGFGNVVPEELNPDGSVKSPAAFKNIRKGRTFWKVASNEGVRAKVLSVPFAFPADTLEEGCMLAGLGVPDLRGTTSTFFLMGEGLDTSSGFSGGKKIALEFDGGSTVAEVEGIRIPGTRSYAKVPVNIKVDRAARSVSLEVAGKEVTLKEGTWSEWIPWAFELSPKSTANAISRFHVLEAGDQVRLYMTCLQFDPEKPYIDFTSPSEYGKELVDRYGHFKTIGWTYDTHALRQDALTEELFLDDVKKTMGWRETLTLDEMDAGKFELLISAWTGTDRVGHMFWHHRDPEHPMHTPEGHAKYGEVVEDTYRQMDETVGKVLAKLGEDDLLMVMSDHGFHSFRTGFNVNTWLIRNGYLSVVGNSDASTATNAKAFLQGYDWSKSKAYSIGLGSIFINQKGREGQGTVGTDDADALIAEIRQKLLEVTDPSTGKKVFSEIYPRDFYSGKATDGAPDLQLGYAEGFQSTKDAAKGVAPAALFEDNMDKWSGDHAASDMATSSGIFFSNKPIKKSNPHLVDIGTTALIYLGKPVPSDFEGEDIF